MQSTTEFGKLKKEKRKKKEVPQTFKETTTKRCYTLFTLTVT